ncbi:MAG: glycosyltransferase [Campylobacter sp.]|nr:glycosyltransferase [Campylobacter sp.]
MQTNILLSIIIPAYNVEKYISLALKMLIEQGLEDCEVIVIDDGSQDNTLDIATKIANKNTYIKIIHQNNMGVSVARNIGIHNSKGRYIYFMDSDDTLMLGTLSFYKEILKKQPGHNMYGFGYKCIYPNKKETCYLYPDFDNKTITNILLAQNFLSKKFCANICSCIYERDFLINNKIEFTKGLAIGEDIEFLLKTFVSTKDMVYYSRIGFVYMIREDSAMEGYKVFSEKHWRSYQIRRDLCLSDKYQTAELKEFANFFIKNEYLSHLIRYLKSSYLSKDISQKFIEDKKYLYKSSAQGASKNSIAILIAKLLPIKLILKIKKGV